MHPIRVLTGHPLRQVLTKPEVSGRIMKWAIELGEHEISFFPRQAIRGQAMTDFLVEANFVEKLKPIYPTLVNAEDEPVKEAPKDYLRVYVDGASRKAGNGVGILLVGPGGHLFTSVHVCNNEQRSGI